MSTFNDLVNDVKQACRETTGEKDQFLLSAAIRLYRQYGRADDWPQTRVTGATLSIATGTQAYDLPADFDRFASDRVNYRWASPSAWPAMSLPVLHRGTIEGDRDISVWESVATTAPYLYPRVVALQPGGANGLRLVVYPLSGTTGDSILFDYYALPSRNGITVGTEIIVDTLYETMVAALSAEYWEYIDDSGKMGMSIQKARASHRNARMTLSRL